MPRAGRKNPNDPVVIDTDASGAQQRIRDAVITGVGWVPKDVKNPKNVRYTTAKYGNKGLGPNDLIRKPGGHIVSKAASDAARTPENVARLIANQAPPFQSTNPQPQQYQIFYAPATTGWFGL